MSPEAIGAWSLDPADAVTPNRLVPPSAVGEDFGSLLLSGVMQTDATAQRAQRAVEAFALGGHVPPHQVMLALEDARLSLHFALQVRSRLVEGYQELMRMQL